MSFTKLLVCYHYGCTDGTIAAYNVHRNLVEAGEEIEEIA